MCNCRSTVCPPLGPPDPQPGQNQPRTAARSAGPMPGAQGTAAKWVSEEELRSSLSGRSAGADRLARVRVRDQGGSCRPGQTSHRPRRVLSAEAPASPLCAWSGRCAARTCPRRRKAGLRPTAVFPRAPNCSIELCRTVRVQLLLRLHREQGSLGPNRQAEPHHLPTSRATWGREAACQQFPGQAGAAHSRVFLVGSLSGDVCVAWRKPAHSEPQVPVVKRPFQRASASLFSARTGQQGAAETGT